MSEKIKKENWLQNIQILINWGIENVEGFNAQELKDGHHSFEELYEIRKLYNAALFNEWSKKGLYDVHKSWRHFDGEECFGGGWFVVIAQLPTGQITNHYEEKDWELFNVEYSYLPNADFDGHTAKEARERLSSFIKGSYK